MDIILFRGAVAYICLFSERGCLANVIAWQHNDPNGGMYPDDQVLVAYLPRPRDLDLIECEGWYRIPFDRAPKGIHAELLAFYFGKHFGERKWAIHAYAPQLGHELVRRLDLLPAERGHARAQDLYYKVQLGPLTWLERPIVNLRWRRLVFLHTTWDRFCVAREVRDLLLRHGDLAER